MSNMSTTFLDREETSKILKVSTRTVDRYLRKYRIKTRRDGRRLLIHRNDVDRIIHDHIGHFIDINVAKSKEMLDRQNVDNVSSIRVQDVQIQEIRNASQRIMEGVSAPTAAPAAPVARAEEDSTIYKGLFQEAKKELKERQERLEAATYRVGQLESQLKNMVPLLDYTRKEKELKETQESMEKQVFEAKVNLEKIERRMRGERVAKWVYLSLVAILLIAEPILFLMWALS